jgi:hypothetical protein
VPFTENLDEFLDTNEFARACLIGTDPLYGIFTANNQDVLDVDGTRPTLLVKDADITSLSIATGTLVNITGVALFYVRRIQPDGTGMSLLVMEEVG